MTHNLRSRVRRALAALLVLVCAAQPAAAAPDESDLWVGEYTFGEDGGRTAGGTPIYIVHQITVTRDGGGVKARLESNGYQTYAAIECEPRSSTSRMRLTFLRHADENVLQRGDYREGDHLLTLVRTRGGRLLTYFGKFRPQFRRARQGRVYFRQVDSSR